MTARTLSSTPSTDVSWDMSLGKAQPAPHLCSKLATSDLRGYGTAKHLKQVLDSEGAASKVLPPSLLLALRVQNQDCSEIV